MPALTKNGDTAHHLFEVVGADLAGIAHRIQDGDGRGQGVGQFLGRGGAGLLQVVATDIGRVPLGDVFDRIGDDVGDQTHRWRGRKDVGAARQVFLEDVVLRGALQLRRRGALPLGHRDVQRQQPGGGGVDGHRGVHLPQRDLVEQCLHVADVADRHADLADLAARQRMIGVVAGLGRQVEGHRQAGLPLAEVSTVQFVGGPGRSVAGIGPHQPGFVAFDLGGHGSLFMCDGGSGLNFSNLIN